MTEIRKRSDAVIPNISAGKPSGDGPRPVIRNPSATLIHNLYLSAPHSDHLDPKYFPWCEDCNPE